MYDRAVGGFFAVALIAGSAIAGTPTQKLRGEAPLLFTQGKDGSFLRDGTLAHTDDIFLWTPALDINGDIDLNATGNFFKIWDSGPLAGPNGNDDDDNEMRGMHFDAPTSSFLISYDDTTTTGFTDLPSISDGDLIRMTPTPSTTGSIINFSLTREFTEGFNGTAGNLSEADIAGFAVAQDGSFYWGSGANTLATTTGGTVSQGSNDFVRTEGFTSSIPNTPRNIGDDVFFNGAAESAPGFINPTFINGQARGIEELITGEVLISVSQTFNQPTALDDGIEVALDRWDIGGLDDVTRMADVVYAGELFFQTIDTASAEMLDFDVLDSDFEIQALIDLIGVDSAAGISLARHVVPAPGATMMFMFAGGALGVRRRRSS